MSYFIGCDVGSGSARAALVNDSGKILKIHVQNIETWNPAPNFYEQSSDNIWNACCTGIKNVTQDINPDNIKGIGFTATCSLVAIDTSGNPLTVSPTRNNNQNVILWMDHRASKEASRINELKHPILNYVGGKISLEMEIPKLLWLKNNMPEQWNKVGYFFDLPDFLTWKATGCSSRSQCSLVCKWNYEIKPEQESWNSSYFKQIDLDSDLQENNWEKIGATILPPGTPVGNGLCGAIARELGLNTGTPVGTSLIDAHAGALGLIGCSVPNVNSDFHSRLSLICGTSTCHMALSNQPVFASGIWGPYYNAVVPGMWLNEGGQSATGKLIDHIIDNHPETPKIKQRIGNLHIQTYLTNILQKLAKKQNLESECFLTKNLHIWPDFHGNRSPIADPNLRGTICGLSLNNDEEDLALLYLATIQALAYGTRHILEVLLQSGYTTFEAILICGGLNKNPLFTQTQADVVNLPVICPNESESVLLGASILGACAANYFGNISMAVKSMGGQGQVVQPNPNVIEFHNKKYKVFLKMYQDQVDYQRIMGLE